MNDYLAGRYTMDEEFDALVKKGKKTEKEVEGMKQLANEIQYAIITRKLRPGRLAALRVDIRLPQSCEPSITVPPSSCPVTPPSESPSTRN